MTADELLDRIDACHDDDPAQAAQGLRTLDFGALAAERRGRVAFLVNHVLGEKLAQWPEALQRQQALLALEPASPLLLRQAGAAAACAGDAAQTMALAEALAAAARTQPRQAAQLIELSAAMFAVSSLGARTAGERALKALRALDEAPWQEGSALDGPAAIACNNIASDFIERPAEALAQASLAAALRCAAEGSQRLWLRAGTWVNHERACYLRAMASHALGEPHRALAHAREGLALLDTLDAAHEQDVDRAFLELEHAHACRRLGLAQDAEAATARAQALADTFNDAGLTQWFESRRTKLATMLRG